MCQRRVCGIRRVLGGPPWPRRDPPARSAPFVSRAEPVPRPPRSGPARSQGVCALPLCPGARAGWGAGPAVPSMQHTRHRPEWGEVAARQQGESPSSMVRLVAVADVRAGVEPVVRADGDGHEREGGEGSGRGQQRLQPAVASHHGGRLIARRPPARPAAPARPAPSAPRRGRRGWGQAQGGGRRRAGALPAASGSNSERGGECGHAGRRAGWRRPGLLPLGPPSPRQPAPPLPRHRRRRRAPGPPRRSAPPSASAPPGVCAPGCARPLSASPRSRRPPSPARPPRPERGSRGPAPGGAREPALPASRFPSPGHPYTASGPGDSNSGVCARARMSATSARTHGTLSDALPGDERTGVIAGAGSVPVRFPEAPDAGRGREARSGHARPGARPPHRWLPHAMGRGWRDRLRAEAEGGGSLLAFGGHQVPVWGRWGGRGGNGVTPAVGFLTVLAASPERPVCAG